MWAANANELAARQWNMKIHLEGYAGWVSTAFQTMSLNFDPELLLWPGGSMIATALWLYAMAKKITLRFGIRLGAKSRPAQRCSRRFDHDGTAGPAA